MTAITAAAYKSTRRGGMTYALQLTGHADYAPAGQDIVCAGVSIVVTALAEWLVEHPERADLSQLQLDEGDVRIVCSGDVAEVMEMAVLAFALLEQQYPKNILLDATNFPALPDANPTAAGGQ